MIASLHAAERLREHWPGANGHTVEVMAAGAEPISCELAAAICGRVRARELIAGAAHRGARPCHLTSTPTLL